MTTNETSFVNSPRSTGRFVTMKIKSVKIAAVSGTANTTAQNKEISLLTSSVVFVVALATWLVIGPATKIRMPRLSAVLRLR
jgi:hypothetical protein